MRKKQLLTDKSGKLYDEMVASAAKELADEMDWTIVADLCLENGWTEVMVDNYHRKYNDGMAEWIFENLKGDKTGYKGRWLFKQASDATWFRLRWLS